jgi:hypothetical protein
MRLNRQRLNPQGSDAMNNKSVLRIGAVIASGFVIPVAVLAASSDASVDAGVVGDWKTTYLTSTGSWKKVWTIKADGKFSMVNDPLAGGDSFSSEGTVIFRNAHCEMQSSSGSTSSASYYLCDYNHLSIDSPFGISNWTRVTENDKRSSVESALQHNNKGVTLFKDGHWTEAIKEHCQACREDPTNTVFRTNLSAALLFFGNILYADGKFEQAGDQFRQALLADPNNQDAANGLHKIENRRI